MARFRNISPTVLKEVQELGHDKKVLCEVIVGRGEQIIENIEEIFLFAYLPPEVAAFKNENDRLKRLAEWVLDLVELERQDELEILKADGNARAVKQLIDFPRRANHEPLEIDHYKNRNEVMVKLLRKEWPHFFEATDNLKLTTTETARVECQKQILIGYLADHKALYDAHATIKPEEAAKFAQDDHYIRLMNEAMNAPKCHVPRTDWQLVSGWIEKNYYRMKDKELGNAFTQDWRHKSGQQKGNTLAKRARDIGLIFARQRGRPEEKPNLLPPG